jgi:hypothetical protein
MSQSPDDAQGESLIQRLQERFGYGSGNGELFRDAAAHIATLKAQFARLARSQEEMERREQLALSLFCVEKARAEAAESRLRALEAHQQKGKKDVLARTGEPDVSPSPQHAPTNQKG